MATTAERSRGLNEPAERARVRAVKFDTPSLNQWAESLAMNLQMHLTQYMVDGNQDHLHEALVVAESLPGVICEQIERASRMF
jgi:hypothetical protein